MTLFRQYFRVQLSGLAIWMTLTGSMGAVIGTVAGSIADTGLEEMLARLPESLRNMVGFAPGLKPVDAFVAGELGLWGGVLLSLYAVVLALGIVTREVDRRTIDFLLAQPISRRQVLLGRIPVLLLNPALVAMALGLGLWTTLTRSGLEASFDRVALMFFNQWLLAMAVGSLTLLASIWIDDYGLGMKLWFGLVAVGMLLEFGLRAGGVERWARFYSPFSYVDAVRIFQDGLPLVDALILLLVSLVALGLSIPAFERKQIAL